MSEPASAAGSPIAAEVIPQLAAAAAQIAAAHQEPAPATIAAAPTTRAKALDVLFRGSTVPASHDAPSYAVVMTGHFASYQGPHSRLAKLPPRRRGRCLVVVIDATTLMPTDATMHDQDDTGLLAQLGPVATLSQ
jgi:hypothetical protein